MTDTPAAVENEKTYTPPPVTGYRVLTQHEVDLMNEIKAAGDAVGVIVAKLRAAPDGALDQRWVSIGATECQQGIMALVRAVAQPSNF